jgi:hypothetical protein
MTIRGRIDSDGNGGVLSDAGNRVADERNRGGTFIVEAA